MALGNKKMSNERDTKQPKEKGHWVSGSSNREGGYDMHPHKGDHGRAQKAGSPRESDYDGPSLVPHRDNQVVMGGEEE